jgi:hypothetical protein
MAKNGEKESNKQSKSKKNPADPRKHPAPGYDELNPASKKDIKQPVKQLKST